MDENRIAPGTTLAGRYELTETLETLPVGEMFRALDRQLGVPRDVLVLRRGVLGSDEAKASFRRDAAALLAVRHGSLVTVHDVFELDAGSGAIVGEPVEGVRLASRLKRRGSIPWPEATRIAVEVLGALDAVHRAGLVHQEVSTATIVVASDAGAEPLELRLLPPALGKPLFDPSVERTMTGAFFGDPKYASPEQLGRLSAGERPDGRSDLYSLGIVLHELIAGEPPFVSRNVEGYILKHLMKAPPPLPAAAAAPEPLESALFRMLEKDREKRFASAAELAGVLSGILGAPERAAGVAPAVEPPPARGEIRETSRLPLPAAPREPPPPVEGERRRGHEVSRTLQIPIFRDDDVERERERERLAAAVKMADAKKRQEEKRAAAEAEAREKDGALRREEARAESARAEAERSARERLEREKLEGERLAAEAARPKSVPPPPVRGHAEAGSGLPTGQTLAPSDLEVTKPLDLRNLSAAPPPVAGPGSRPLPSEPAPPRASPASTSPSVSPSPPPPASPEPGAFSMNENTAPVRIFLGPTGPVVAEASAPKTSGKRKPAPPPAPPAPPPVPEVPRASPPVAEAPQQAAAPPVTPRRRSALPLVVVALAAAALLGAWLIGRTLGGSPVPPVTGKPAPEPAPAPPAPPPPEPEAESASAAPSAAERIAGAKEKLDAGDPDAAARAVAALDPATRAALSPAESEALAALETALASARAEQVSEALRAAFAAGDLPTVRRVVGGASAEDLTKLPFSPEDLGRIEKARKILAADAAVESAVQRNDDEAVVRTTSMLLRALPGESGARELRERSSAAIEAESERLASAGDLPAALEKLDRLRRLWPGRPGLAERIGRFRTEQETDRRLEQVLADAARAGRERRPEAGIALLRGARPTARFEARFREAAQGLEQRLAELDRGAPTITLADPKLEYDRSRPAVVELTIEDDHGVRSAEAFARIDSSGAYVPVPLTRDGDRWTLRIEPSFHDNETVELYVTAIDASGHRGQLGSADRPQKLKKKGWLF